jgi:hypothetical protein
MERHYDPEGESREQDKERAEDLGLSGCEFIGREHDPAVCRALAELVSRRLHKKFVSPESVKALHEEMTPETASSTATHLSIELLQRAIRKLFEVEVKDLRSDIRQIVNGTTMGTREGLSMVCLGLQEDPDILLATASYAVDSFAESLSTYSGEEFRLPRVEISSGLSDVQDRTFLRERESVETIRALGEILRDALAKTMVAPRDVRELHPDIPPEMADGCAYELSLTLVMARLSSTDKGRSIDGCSLNQVLGGTLSGRVAAFEALCGALDLSSAEVLSRARDEGAQSRV